ncbi:hypothetical protein Naga_100008g99 [Nannochloropsis gaditana]|uniref:Uncharacterized protein n=1 Tax=Nannochloropsis gaditana TaxID=72520 RepID=W7TWX3_9STRA|nr:hypothetical protein Naga_100008g99 [Nannochloropsis gaditana]
MLMHKIDLLLWEGSCVSLVRPPDRPGASHGSTSSSVNSFTVRDGRSSGLLGKGLCPFKGYNVEQRGME